MRIVLADDHAVVRAGLRMLLESQPDMAVVGEAADGEAACDVVRQSNPDVLVIDLSMPGMGGAEATARVRREHPDVTVVALTAHEERVYLAQVLRAGAAGYVLKRAAPVDLVRAIRSVLTGAMYLDPAVVDVVIDGFLDRAGDTAATPPSLSEREEEVLRRIARGFSNKEIAAELGLSVKTVETYKARVADKLGLRTRVDIVRYAARQGWLGGATPDA